MSATWSTEPRFPPASESELCMRHVRPGRQGRFNTSGRARFHTGRSVLPRARSGAGRPADLTPAPVWLRNML